MTNVIYRFDEDGIFTPPIDIAMEDPMVRGRFLKPAFASFIETPSLKENEVAQIVDISNPIEWKVIKSYKGLEAFNKETKESFIIDKHDELDNSSTFQKCPSPECIYSWDDEHDSWNIKEILLRKYLGFLATMVVLKARAELKNPWNSAVVLNRNTDLVSVKYSEAVKTYIKYTTALKKANFAKLIKMFKDLPKATDYQFCSVCGGPLTQESAEWICNYCGFSTVFCNK